MQAGLDSCRSLVMAAGRPTLGPARLACLQLTVAGWIQVLPVAGVGTRPPSGASSALPTGRVKVILNGCM